ncbi:MAG TPA: PDZ domain-containing protein [Candidatus Sulfotelmatobacter sp.]|nr:PDZ domain-containing protein [Candidatus Sulfotelmatobacter sp.]
MPLVRIRAAIFVWFILIATLAFSQQLPEGRLMRFPDIHGDKIAFVYGGDIWLASASGGAAHRITTHPGRELFPKFSPDGKWIAFTGQYDGNFNVYVMSSSGSQPRQLTFYQGSATQLNDRMGIHNQVITWTPDSKRIVFLSRRDASNGWTKRQFTISIDGGLPEPLPMDQGGLTSFNADGTKIAYNRIFRNFRTWKRYTGGLAQDIYIYDLKNNVFEQQIPHTDYTDTFPMWHGNTVYFTSDRGTEHRFNVYAYDLGTKQVEQITHFTEFDVMWPSLGDSSIVFENGGYLYVLDLSTRQATKLTIALPGERDLTMKHWASVSKNITEFDIAPDGKRAVFAARGDVFTVPAKEGATRNLTRTPGIREKEVAWSPDGRWIAFVSDRTGEDEIYITPQDGMGNVELGKENETKEKEKDKEAAAKEAAREKERGKDKEQQITSGYKGFKFVPAWSPDSKKLAWADKDLRLWYVDIDAKKDDRKPVEVDRGKYNEITNYAWSPDSKWLAYDKAQQSGLSIVYLYSTADQKITAVTSELVNSQGPVFDPEGNYLYFLSDRDYNEVLGNFDFEFANPKTTRPYLVTLRADAASPFPALSDETAIKHEEPAAEASESEKGEKDKDKSKDNRADEKKKTSSDDRKKEEVKREREIKEVIKNFRIDLEGIQNRIVALPVPPASVSGMGAAKGFLYYSTQPVQGLSGPLPGEESAIHAYDLKERKEKTLIEGIDRWTISFDGTKILYQAKEAYGIIDAKADGPKKPGEGALNLSGLRAEIDPPAEWKQIFNEVWRQERDFFFEASMNGVNWEAIRDKYAPLVPYAANRYDLTYILGEVIGELSNSHTYVGGGDQPDLHPVNMGLLGVDFELDSASGLYRFKKIYPGENWNPQTRSPLTEPGVNVREGEYLLAVNGRALRAPQNPYELFVNTANETTAITVNSKPNAEGARTLPVKPIADEYPLRELNMVETNRKKVDAATHGRVGYLYLPDMGDAGLNAFVKQYFPQIRKEGLIIDVRYNGGGFVDQLIFERLRRILAGMDSARNWESNTVPPVVFHGYMAAITNQYAASDGDIFSEFFKVYKLGPLIGERTWGGVRGIRGEFALIDGGYITRPEFSRYDLNSKWVVENRGVAPDIEVDNRPDDVVRGRDAQLERAIQEVMKQIDANPKKLPPRPPDLPAYPEGPAM